MSTGTSSARLRVVPLLRLAWRDLWHERALTVCAIFTVAAALAPVWMLWALQQGIVGTLLDRQSQDPSMRLIMPTGGSGRSYDAAWFERIGRWRGVAFVIPDVRRIAADIEVSAPSAPAPAMLTLFPTAVGDPMLGGGTPPARAEVHVSARAAALLKLVPGTLLRSGLERTRDGKAERALLVLKVGRVLDPAALGGVAGLVHSDQLEDVEAWRDSHRVEGLGDGSGEPPLPRATRWTLFRLYTNDIRDVEPIGRRLEDEEGVALRSDNSREIATILRLQRNLQQIVSLVAVVTVCGSAFALSALQASNLRRKRREWALLSLTGHGRSWLMALPCVQSSVIALAGAGAAFLLYAAGAAAVAHHFADQIQGRESAARLDAVDIGAGVAIALCLGLLPAAWAGWRASNQESADELRDY